MTAERTDGVADTRQSSDRQRSWFDPHRPFSPAGSPVFYGWIIVVVGTLGIIMSIPGQTTGVSVFTDPLISATGLSRAGVSLAYLVGTAASGVFLPLGGRAVDRFGVRQATMGATLALAASLVFLSQVDVIGKGLGGTYWAMLFVLILGFTALRFSGQGMLTLASRTMIGRWFDKKRGRVAARSGIFVSFSFSAAPLFFSALIDGLSWRYAWLLLAGVIGLVMTVLVYVFYRDNPESVGLRMDGVEPTENAETKQRGPAFTPVEPLTRTQAIRTRAFWAVTCTLATQGLIVTGFTFHIVDLGALAGLSRSEAVAFFLPNSLVSVSMGFLIGRLSERVRVKTLLLGMACFEVVGVLAAANFHHPVGRVMAVVGFGGAGGFFGPLSTLALPRYFGRRHLGAITGVQMMVMVLGSAVGPSLLASSRGISGAYALGLYGTLTLVGLSIALALSVKEDRLGVGQAT